VYAGKMWEWEEWDEASETTPDLSPNELGLIPLCCPGIISSCGRRCSTKLFNAPQKRRQGGIAYQRVQCLLCGWSGFRKIGLKRGKSE